MDSFYQSAYALVSSAEARAAFDLAAEPEALRIDATTSSVMREASTTSSSVALEISSSPKHSWFTWHLTDPFRKGSQGPSGLIGPMLPIGRFGKN